LPKKKKKEVGLKRDKHHQMFSIQDSVGVNININQFNSTAPLLKQNSNISDKTESVKTKQKKKKA
jgi:hypothetical protein